MILTNDNPKNFMTKIILVTMIKVIIFISCHYEDTKNKIKIYKIFIIIIPFYKILKLNLLYYKYYFFHNINEIKNPSNNFPKKFKICYII